MLLGYPSRNEGQQNGPKSRNINRIATDPTSVGLKEARVVRGYRRKGRLGRKLGLDRSRQLKKRKMRCLSHGRGKLTRVHPYLKTTTGAIAVIPIASATPSTAEATILSIAVETLAPTVLATGMTPIVEASALDVQDRAFPTGLMGSILEKVEKFVGPVLKDLDQVCEDRAKLREALNVKKNLTNQRKEKIQTLEEERRGLMKK